MLCELQRPCAVDRHDIAINLGDGVHSLATSINTYVPYIYIGYPNFNLFKCSSVLYAMMELDLQVLPHLRWKLWLENKLLCPHKPFGFYGPCIITHTFLCGLPCIVIYFHVRQCLTYDGDLISHSIVWKLFHSSSCYR